MHKPVEHEILNAHKYKNTKKFAPPPGPVKSRTLFFPLIHVKMPTIIGILTFMGGKNFMPNRAEHDKSVITLGPGHPTCQRSISRV